jgi:large subunit ribosomal protein L7/L12
MNIFKKIALSAAMVAAFATVSAPAFAAEEHKDRNAAVKTAADLTKTKIEEAISLADKGDKTAFLATVSEVRQAQKEFRYEQTERLRQKLNDRLAAARESATSDNMPEASIAIKAALNYVKEMREIYDAAHK